MPYPDNIVTSNTVNTKMKAIADEVRELSGTSEPLGLNAMATNIGAANDEIDSQTELLAQAIAALEGKAAGGGSSTQSKVVSLQVKKITADTYANETTYSGEQFISLEIYPKPNGTVTVTYGGLTKTITDTDTGNAIDYVAYPIFFGTFNGVSDSISTPASGELTIAGDYIGFAVNTYNTAKATAAYCSCITAVNNFGTIKELQPYNFAGCTDLASIIIPDSIAVIDEHAFEGCTGLTSITIPDNVKRIESLAFNKCTSLTSITMPNSGIYIGDSAFSDTAYYNDESNWINDVLYIGNHLIKARSTLSDSYTIKHDTFSIAANAFNGCTKLTELHYDDLSFVDSSSIWVGAILNSMNYPSGDNIEYLVNTHASYAWYRQF